MSRTPLRNKAVLILGADTPVGRAISLQLSREGAKVVIAGREKETLGLLAEFLVAKGGSPTEVSLARGIDHAVSAIREARDTLGHLHVVINAVPAHTIFPEMDWDPAVYSRELTAALEEVLRGRGQLRRVTIWPDGAGEFPARDEEDSWHCFLRMKAVSYRPEGGDPGQPEAIKPAGVADTVVCLLQCPPAACPVEVRLEERGVKY